MPTLVNYAWSIILSYSVLSKIIQFLNKESNRNIIQCKMKKTDGRRLKVK